ncbi:MAG: hypothetical protein II871_03345 [Clostridia bacterium]|nr:hypothetical protein [Clostridia bacterium]
MRNIYDFEAEKPPALNENVLRDTLEKKRSKRLALLLMFAYLPVYATAALLAARAYKTDQILTGICIAFIAFSALGSLLCAAAFSVKEDRKHECSTINGNK